MSQSPAFGRAPVTHVVFTFVTVHLCFSIPLAKSEASFIGYLEQISPDPQIYLQGADFQPFGDDPGGIVAIGDVVGFLQAVPDFGDEASDFAGFTAGNFALIERGVTTFSAKVIQATDAGAIGVLIFNNVLGEPFQGWFLDPTTIPALSITQSHGQQFLGQLACGLVEVRLTVQAIPRAVVSHARCRWSLGLGSLWLASSPHPPPVNTKKSHQFRNRWVSGSSRKPMSPFITGW